MADPLQDARSGDSLHFGAERLSRGLADEPAKVVAAADIAAGTTDRDLGRLTRGVVIDGRRTLPARARLLRVVTTRSGEQAVVELTIREGRNRQVRRMCDAIAHPVERLRRVRIGPLTAEGLRPGALRDLTAPEVAALRRGAPARPVVRSPKRMISR